MKIHSQIIIDKYLIYPFAILINVASKLLGKIFSINHSLKIDFERIAVCKFKGMGSIIQATPLLESLRLKYPNAQIIFISSKQNEAILKRIDLVDSYILLDDSSLVKIVRNFPSFLINIIRHKVQLYFDLEIYSNFSSIVAIASFATNRIGFYLRSSNYKLGIYTHMLFYNMRLPINQVYLQMGRLLDIEKKDYNLHPLQYEKSVLDDCKELPDDFKKRKYIIINPNASDLRVERRWTSEGFISLCNLIAEKYEEYYVFFIGSKAEEQYTQFIFEHTNQSKNVFNLAGKTSLDELIALIANTEIIITNDTGPMHIGFSLNTPVVALFGPCLPNQYGNHSNSISIHKNVYCSPCVHEFIVPPCKGNNACMKLISVDEVFNAVSSKLNKLSYTKESEEQFSYYIANDALGVVNRAPGV